MFESGQFTTLCFMLSANANSMPTVQPYPKRVGCPVPQEFKLYSHEARNSIGKIGHQMRKVIQNSQKYSSIITNNQGVMQGDWC